MAQRSGSIETAKMSFNYCIARKSGRDLIWQFDQQRHHQINIANILWSTTFSRCLARFSSLSEKEFKEANTSLKCSLENNTSNKLDIGNIRISQWSLVVGFCIMKISGLVMTELQLEVWQYFENCVHFFFSVKSKASTLDGMIAILML